MKKKSIAVILAASLVFSLCACGQSTTTATSSSSSGSDSATSSASSDDTLSQEEAELAALGDVEVNNGILTVSITLPKDFVNEEITQEALDEKAGESYVSAKLNDDGSVTYKLTKAQHREMLTSIKESLDTSIQDIVDDDNYAIASIDHNDDYTSFDVTVEGTEVGLYESFAAIGLYMYGGMYGIFSGHSAENVTVNYLDPNGNIISTGNSSELGNSSSAVN